MRHHKRKRLYIDAKVQGGLLVRVAVYWMTCVLTVECLSLSWHIATGPQQPNYAAYFLNQDWRPCAVRLVASVLLLGPILYDMLKLSNRFTGPVYRMQQTLKRVVENGTVHHIRLRDDDYWHDLASDLNAALARLNAEHRKPARTESERVVPLSAIADAHETLANMEAQLRQLSDARGLK